MLSLSTSIFKRMGLGIGDLCAACLKAGDILIGDLGAGDLATRDLRPGGSKAGGHFHSW